MQKNKISLVVATLLLSSCATSNIGSNWQCPTPSVKGQQCRNIASADNLAKGPDEGEADSIKVDEGVIVLLKSHNNLEETLEVNPIRTGEKISRIWFAPFVDKYSNRHEPSIVQIVDTNSTWR